MPTVPVRARPEVDLSDGFRRIRDELGIAGEFPPEVEAEAAALAGRTPPGPRLDLRDIDFVTIDPPGSTDLDQAVAIDPRGSGWLIRYAIADVAAFVAPGSAIDVEARRRVVTVYLPDGRVPLHPPALSEGAASLLPGVDRPALVWSLAVDDAGLLVDVGLERATVRSRAALDYATVQRAADTGDADDVSVARRLRTVGEALLAQEAARGGASLPIPDQEVEAANGRYRLVYRAPLRAEAWNAQISLLAGRAAAAVMVDGGSGIVRTLPPPEPDDLATFRREAISLGVAWPDDASYADFIRRLDPAEHSHAALLVQATRLFRGAGYEAFDGGQRPGAHAAVAAPYAHVTAPLRRLVDRFANELVLAHLAGTTPADWALAALPELPDLMRRGRSLEGSANRMALDLVEAAVLSTRIGERLAGVIVDTRGGRARVQIVEPAVVADLTDADGVSLGDTVAVEVTRVELAERRIELRLL